MKRNRPSIFLSTFVAANLFACAIPCFAADWSQYRGNSHDGKTPEKISSWPKDGLRQVWKAPASNGFSSLVVGDGKAFTLISEEVDGAPREVCLALDANTGKRLWAAPIGIAKYEGGGDSGAKGNNGGDGPRSTPSYSDGRVYAISGDLVLACLNGADGAVIWKKDIIKEFQGKNIGWRNAASPLIDGDLLFMAGGGAGQALLAFNKADGSVAWKGQDDKMTHATPTLAVIGGVKQVIFLTQKGLVSVAPETGKVLWRQAFDYSTSTAASPVVFEDVVYCSAGYGTGAGAYQVKKTGDEFSTTELWRLKGNKLANHWSTPIVKDGYLYGMFQFKEYADGPVKCVDIRTGKEMWSQAGFGPGNVILAGSELVALGDAGQLVLIDPNPAKYTELARFDNLDGKCWSTPAFCNGRLYVRSVKEAACFDTGAKVTAK
jgi:outer membrane protein assembly factor BamB